MQWRLPSLVSDCRVYTLVEKDVRDFHLSHPRCYKPWVDPEVVLDCPIRSALEEDRYGFVLPSKYCVLQRTQPSGSGRYIRTLVEQDTDGFHISHKRRSMKRGEIRGTNFALEIDAWTGNNVRRSSYDVCQAGVL